MTCKQAQEIRDRSCINLMMLMLYEMSKVSHADLHASYREYVYDGYICVDQCRERSLFSPNLTIDQSEVG
jgi:hypothetical protein